MININRHILSNGLRLIHHRDATTKMVALNLLYNVGSKDEQVGKTGQAHLFEHLMFSRTDNVESFDEALQKAGGESNAWTSEDFTNFYETIPAHNVETAFWLESERLMHLQLTNEAVEVQRSVVIEEFKQRCLNQPYGDVQKLMRGLCYKQHPYRWPVIGDKVEDIENAAIDDIRAFYNSHYSPDNLVLCVSGNIEFDRAVALAEKWFSGIERRNVVARNLPVESVQTEPRRLVVNRDVPHTIVYRAYKMCGRQQPDFKYYDILTDVLANGRSARFFQNVLLKSDSFAELDASVNAAVETGLLYVKASLREGVKVSDAEKEIDAELARLISEPVSDYEVEKYVNKYISFDSFENVAYAEKATKLCRFEMLGEAEDFNREPELYRHITADDVNNAAQKVFRPENCCSLIYGPDV